MRRALSKKRGRKPTRNPWAEENCKLKAELVQVKRKLQQAEIIIDVQKLRGGLPRSGSSAGLFLLGSSATAGIRRQRSTAQAGAGSL